jgi:hypothetical protein
LSEQSLCGTDMAYRLSVLQYPSRWAERPATNFHSKPNGSSSPRLLCHLGQFSRQKYLCEMLGWRKRRDSNPRYLFRYASFQDWSHQPLGHSSLLEFSMRLPPCAKHCHAMIWSQESVDYQKGRGLLYDQGYWDNCVSETTCLFNTGRSAELNSPRRAGPACEELRRK